MNVTAKVNEAETYLSMGLLEESLMVYEQIHSNADALDDAAKQNIAGKISDLKNDVDHLEQNEHNSICEKEIAFLKNALSVTDEIPEINNCAASFFELGLFKEALCEYGKLLCRDHESKDLIPNTTTCLLKCFSSNDIRGCLDEIIKDEGIENTKKVKIRFLISQELEKRNLNELALKFYDSGHRSDSTDHAIKRRPKSLFSFNSLLNIVASIFALTVLSFFIVFFLNICSIFYFFINLKPV